MEETENTGLTENQLRKKELAIIRKLYSKGQNVKKMEEDGNCQFRAISDQLYGEMYHNEIREICTEYLLIEQDYFKDFTTIPNNFGSYVQNMKKKGIWGGNIELQALSEIYNIKIEIYVWDDEPINIFNEDCDTDYDTVKLFYRKVGHYDSITKNNNESIIKVEFGVLEKEAISLAKSRKNDNVNNSKQMKETRLKFERKCNLLTN